MISRSLSLLVALASLLPRFASGAEAPVKPSSWPEVIPIGDISYRVTEPHDAPSPRHRDLPASMRMEDEALRSHLDEKQAYWLGRHLFLRPPGHRFAFPFQGSAPFVSYLDLDDGSLLPLSPDLPPTGESRDSASVPRYEWTGFLDPKANSPGVFWLLVRKWNRETNSYTASRARIDPAAPDSSTVIPMDDLVITRVLDQVPGEILCEIADGRERSWARVSTTDWRILAREKPGTDRGRLGTAAYSPDRNSVYAVFSTGGLVIFESESGESVRDFDRIGSFGNAPTQGVTFDPSGTLAAVATPYRKQLTLIEVSSGRIVGHYQAPKALAGIRFDAAKLEATPQATFLPYE